jgi:hypothetical protein
MSNSKKVMTFSSPFLGSVDNKESKKALENEEESKQALDEEQK